MKNRYNRRTVAGCALLISGKISAIAGYAHLQNERPDPKKLNYCGYTWPTNWQFLEASVKNDADLKKKAYETWEMKNWFGVAEFDPDKIFCFWMQNQR